MLLPFKLFSMSKHLVLVLVLVAIVPYMENCSTTVYEKFLQVYLKSNFHKKNLV